MEDIKLGKIISIEFGIGGYQDAQLGLSVTLGNSDWGVSTGKQYWSAVMIECSSHTKWTEDDRNNSYAEIMRYVDRLLHDAKKKSISELKNVPVEVVFEKGELKSWRILTEVL